MGCMTQTPSGTDPLTAGPHDIHVLPGEVPTVVKRFIGVLTVASPPPSYDTDGTCEWVLSAGDGKTWIEFHSDPDARPPVDEKIQWLNGTSTTRGEMDRALDRCPVQVTLEFLPTEKM